MFQGLSYIFMKIEGTAEELGHRFSGEVVCCGSEAYCPNDEVPQLCSMMKCPEEPLLFIPKFQDCDYFYTHRKELVCDVGRIGVHHLSGDQFLSCTENHSFVHCG